MIKAIARLDAWLNQMTGINTKSHDRRSYSKAQAIRLSEQEVEEIYAADVMAAKIVEMLPEDMVREGFKLIIPEWPEEELRMVIEYLESNLHWKPIFKEAMAWARLYGGAGCLVGIDDGAKDLSEPLNEAKINRFDYLTCFHRYELRTEAIERDPTKDGYGKALLYSLQASAKSKAEGRTYTPLTNTRSWLRAIDGKSGTRIHASRIIRFDGCKLPRKHFQDNDFWDDSVLSKRKMALADYGTSYDATAALMADVSQAVIKMKNLHEIMSAADGELLVNKRIDMIDSSRSVLNAIVISDDEDYQRQTTSLAGIPEILRKMEERLVAGSEYPHNLLLGEAPGSGLGETGKAELRNYYDMVSKRQETILKPALKRLIQLAFLNKNGPTKGKEPASWDIEFLPLWQESEETLVGQRQKQAAVDEIYIRSGVLSPDEVAESRFGSGVYSHDTMLLIERTQEQGDGDVSSDDRDNLDAPQKTSEVVPESTTTPVPGNTQGNQATTPQASLNGAQVSSMVAVINQVAQGLLPRESGVSIIQIAFSLSEENAEAVMGSVGKGFTPTPPPEQKQQQ